MILFSKLVVGALAILAAGGAFLQQGTASPALREVTISVPGIPGPYCMYGIEKRLIEIPQIESVRLLWEEEEIRAILRPGTTVSREQIEAAIERAEYPYEYTIAQ